MDKLLMFEDIDSDLSLNKNLTPISISVDNTSPVPT